MISGSLKQPLTASDSLWQPLTASDTQTQNESSILTSRGFQKHITCLDSVHFQIWPFTTSDELKWPRILKNPKDPFPAQSQLSKNIVVEKSQKSHFQSHFQVRPPRTEMAENQNYLIFTSVLTHAPWYFIILCSSAIRPVWGTTWIQVTLSPHSTFLSTHSTFLNKALEEEEKKSYLKNICSITLN